MKLNKRYDISIVGGGVVGSVMALLLANSGFRVALIDKNSPIKTVKDPASSLASTLTYASVFCLQELSIWPQLKEEQKHFFTNLCAWKQHAWEQRIEFNCFDEHYPFLGAVVYNLDLLAVLHQKILKHSECEWISGCVDNLDVSDKHVVLSMSGIEPIRSQLLIGADGAHSWIKKQLNCATSIKEYNQHALVTTVTTEQPLLRTAWQVFTPSGPAALLPCSGDCEASLVWSQDTSKANALYSMQKKSFEYELSKTFENRFGYISCQRPLIQAPLIRRHAATYYDKRVVLIGDAVRTIHPLAGQGLNLGILDAMKLHTILSVANQRSQDIGSAHYLRQYERQRRAHNQVMLATMDFFHYGFTNNNKLLNSLLPFGVQAVNRFNFVKNKIMKQAMGLA